LIDIFVDLNSGTVKQDIAAIPNKLLEGAEEAILQVADLMKGLWQIHIRVDTGSARDSIRVERGGLGMHWREVRVRGGGYVVNPKTGRLVDYMGIIELKYGAGRQAWNEVQPEALAIINRVCLDQIRQLASVTV
jgi:hypothetical protein